MYRKAFCYLSLSRFTITPQYFQTFTITPFIASQANSSQTHWYTILYRSSKMMISSCSPWPLSCSFHYHQLQTKAIMCLILHEQPSLAGVIIPCNRMLLSFLCAIPRPSPHVLNCRLHLCQCIIQFLRTITLLCCSVRFISFKY